MREIVTGHTYALANLRDDGEQVLQFQSDAPLHDDVAGTSCQEVIRALVARVQALDAELAWTGNQDIVWHLRGALAGFEARALIRKAEKGAAVEGWPVGDDGHFIVETTRGAKKAVDL